MRGRLLPLLVVGFLLTGCPSLQPPPPPTPPPVGSSGNPAPPGPKAPPGPGATTSGSRPPVNSPAKPIAPVQAIGSFNLEWFALDGSHPRTDEQLRHVAEVIQSTGMALIGLQEIRDNAVMDRLITFLPGWKYALGTSGRAQKCGILWDSARAAVRRPLEWADINDGLEKTEGTLRAPLVAEAKVGNFDFTFVVLHSKAMFDDKSIGTRRTQFRRLRERLDEYIAGRADKDVIIVGDYNDFADSPALKELTRKKEGKVGFVVTDAKLPKTATTHMSPDGRIDHVAVSAPYVSEEEWKGTAETYPKPRGAERKAYEGNVSDHLPIWAEFDTATDRD